MGKNIYVEALEPFSFKEDLSKVYPKTYKLWVDKETFERLIYDNLCEGYICPHPITREKVYLEQEVPHFNNAEFSILYKVN